MRTFFMALAGMTLLSVAAHATPIAGNTSYTSSGASGVVQLTNDLSSFSFNLSGVGASTTLNILTLAPDPGNGSHTYDFSVTENITFTLPGIGGIGDLGTGTFHVQGNSVNTGGLTWADGSAGTDVTLSGGWVVNINLSDISFVGDSAGGSNSEVVGATFTLVSVPEPASIALLAAGLLGLGFFRRRARR